MAVRTLYQTLLDTDAVRLRVLAEAWKVDFRSTAHADRAAELADMMARAPSVEAALAALSPEEQSALEEIQRRGGVMPWPIFCRRWGEVRTVGSGRLEREQLWRAPISTAEALWYRGWIQRAFDRRWDDPVDVAFIPEELLLYMPSPPPLVIPSPLPCEAPEKQVLGGDSLADDLLALWIATVRHPLKSSTLLAYEALLRKVHPPAILRLELLHILALEQGWIKESEGAVLRLVPEAVGDWLSAGTWEQWQALGEAWISSHQWDDLAHVPTLRPDATKGWLPAPQRARQAFLDLLAHCQPRTWYNIDAFTAYVSEYGTDFLRPEGNYELWAPVDVATGTPLRGFESWHAVEGALVLFLLTGPLAWLGAIDLGSDETAQGWTSFRLSEAGAAWLQLASPPDIPPCPELVIDDDGSAIVPARRRYERFQLARVADEVGRGDGHRFRFTPRSLQAARQQRIPVKRILEFVAESTKQTLAPHLQWAIEHAYAGDRGATLDQVWLLRISDAETRRLPALAALVVEWLTPEVAVVRPEDRKRILAILARQGILVDGDDL